MGSSEKKISRKEGAMPEKRALLKLLAGAVLFAIFVFVLMSAPGFLSDRDSTTPSRPQHQPAAR
jgi:hypothetical protein